MQLTHPYFKNRVARIECGDDTVFNVSNNAIYLVLD
jgi:hypothetical protein